MKKLILLALFLILPAFASAAESQIDLPHWSFEVKGGNFAPDVPDWSRFYGRRDVPEYALALAYKVIRQIEVGVEAGSATAKGRAFAPLHNVIAGDVTLELHPVNAFVLFRGVVSEAQWIVPYAGGGYTRLYYTEKTEGQDTVRGAVNGYRARAGLQFLLDGLDRGGANSLYMDYGVDHTYLFVEGTYMKAKVKDTSVNLGGNGWLAGLLFEF